MQKEEMISLSAMQHVALIGVYQSLAWDLRFGTRNTQSLKSINKVLRQNFKNKSEAFDFIHRLDFPLRVNRRKHTHNPSQTSSFSGFARDDTSFLRGRVDASSFKHASFISIDPVSTQKPEEPIWELSTRP